MLFGAGTGIGSGSTVICTGLHDCTVTSALHTPLLHGRAWASTPGLAQAPTSRLQRPAKKIRPDRDGLLPGLLFMCAPPLEYHKRSDCRGARRSVATSRR